MSAPTAPLVLTTPEQRARFAGEVSGRVTIVAALRLASHALFDAGNHETSGTFAQRAFRFVGERLGRWASRREDRLRDEFFPQAVEFGVTAPLVTLAPYGIAWVTVTVDGDDESEIVYETHPVDEAREALFNAVENSGATTDPALDDLATQRVASHAPTAVPRIVQWLAKAKAAGRAEAEEEADQEQQHREYVAARTCSDCGKRGRGAEEHDIPHDEYDVRDASEWLEVHDGLIICDNCGHRWWVS